MSAPTKQPVNALDRCTQRSTQSIVQPKETSVLQAQALSADIPVGVLELPVRVWGSRRIKSDSGQPERVEVLAEETCTVIVFPYGAVIRLSAAVEPGQLMMVANRKSDRNVLCRVVNVKKYSSARGYAEIEFLQPANGFWEAYIPQGTLKLTERARIPAAMSVTPAKPGPVAPNPASTQDWIPTRSATPSKSPAVAPEPPEDFWSSSFPKEAISVLADAVTASEAPAPTVRNKMESIENCAIHVPSVGKLVQRAAMHSTASESPFETTERNVSKPNPLLSPTSANSRISDLSSTQEHQRDKFANERSALDWIRGLLGPFLGQVITRTANRNPSARRQMVFVRVTVTSLFLMGASGILLLHRGTLPSAATTQTNLTPIASTDSPFANTMQSPQPESNSTSIAMGPRIPVKVEGFPGSRSSELADNVAHFSATDKKATSVGKFPNVRLLAPHLVERRPGAAIDRDAPPDMTAVDPNINASATQGVLATLSHVGGRVREPRLVTRTVPSYPAAARLIRTEGEVTINAVIDTSGKLTNLKVVSGAPLLRQAALDSLRDWKYEPGYLDDNPVEVKTSITVKFRLR